MAENNVLPNTVPPVVLSGQLADIVAAGTVPNDVLLEGLPFRIRPSDENPLLHQLLEEQKDQFDTSREAGENSFGTWWLRSQSTFHGGQGQTYIDSSVSEFSRMRFLESRYAVTSTAGELSIGGAVTSAASSKNKCEQVTWSGVQRLVTASTAANQIKTFALPDLSGETTITMTGAVGTPTDITTDGSNVFVAIDDRIYRVESTGTATHIYDLTFTGPVVMGFAKQRLIVCVANSIYELDPDPATPPDPAPAAHYVNPSTDYVYTCVAEGPNGIYVSGYSGTKSNIASMSVTEVAGTVTLGPPVQQLELPPGELVNFLFFYVGALFAIATTSGVRAGAFTPYGQPIMGSLMMEGTPCHSLTGSSTLIWIGAEDSIWWMDLATPIGDNIYATTMYADGLGATADDPVTNVTVFTDDPDLVFGTTEAGNLISQPEYVADEEATLTTSWVRFDTTEMKRLHYVAIEGELPAVGGVDAVLTIVVEASSGSTKTFNVEGGGSNYEFSCEGLSTAQAYRLHFTLRDAGSGNGVKLRSWQMKALPAPARFPEVVYPLMLSDFERPSQGEEYGYLGFARDRLLALMDFGRASAKITVVDRILNIQFQAVINRLQFQQVSSPTAINGLSGIINVVLKQV